FILVLGLVLGEGFGQKPDDRLRVSVVDLDKGYADPATNKPAERWSEVVLRDLAQTAGIRVEVIDGRAEAERLTADGRRAAVLVFGPDFSARVAKSSFLADGINPFHRDGVNLQTLDAELLRDPTQLTAASIMEQAAQGSLLRVVLPWMIGRAFEKVGDPDFLTLLGKEKELPGLVKTFLTSPLVSARQKKDLSRGLQNALQNLFPNYNLTAKTWAALTKSTPHTGEGAALAHYTGEAGGLLKRG